MVCTEYPLLNTGALTHLHNEVISGRVRSTAQAVLLFDPKWRLDRVGWPKLCPIASWSRRIEFDEKQLCHEKKQAGAGSFNPRHPASCTRAQGHFIVAGFPVADKRIPLLLNDSKLKRSKGYPERWTPGLEWQGCAERHEVNQRGGPQYLVPGAPVAVPGSQRRTVRFSAEPENKV